MGSEEEEEEEAAAATSTAAAEEQEEQQEQQEPAPDSSVVSEADQLKAAAKKRLQEKEARSCLAYCKRAMELPSGVGAENPKAGGPRMHLSYSCASSFICTQPCISLSVLPSLARMVGRCTVCAACVRGW